MSPGRKRPVDMATVRESRARLWELIREHPELTSPESQARLGAWFDTEKAKENAMTKKQAAPFRLDDEDIRRLERLSERHPVVTRSGIARAAFRLGLDLLEEDPTRLLAGPKPTKKR